MNTGDARPDPDALLKRVTEEEKREKRARLKIFFGFAPGVGKTYRMLQAARDLAEQEVDVVIGVAETHGRYETASLLLGMNILPRRKIDHRGRIIEEFDLDAAIARKPKILLLDELAHSNAPGSRHTKRWQDALELLEAGIEVWTTLNVQHIESLNDVVAQITGVVVRETVPDSILERADEVELVDIAPEELLTRLKEGKVYLGEAGVRAMQHFFQRGNLLALRELALRRTAERVDADVLAYRSLHGVDATWPTTERILVCVGPSPASARLVRAARRMAAGLRAPWAAVYVEALGQRPLRDADRERLEAHLRLAESLGGEVVRLTGTRVSEQLLDYARKRNVTRLIIGKPTHARILDRLRGSLLDEVVRGSGDIDVHVISGDVEGSGKSAPMSPLPRDPLEIRGYLWAALIMFITTGLALAIRRLLPVPDLEMLFLVAVMITGALAGRGPSILAAALGVALYDVFFVPPFLTFAVADGRYFLTFAMMFVAGIAISSLASRLRRQEIEARAREERTHALFTLARDLSSGLGSAEIAAIIAEHASDVFNINTMVLLPGRGGSLEPAASIPKDLPLSPTDMGVARWTFDHGRPAGIGTDTLPGAKALCTPLRVSTATRGVLLLMPERAGTLRVEQRTFLEAFARQAAFALERAELSDQARRAALRAKTEELRSSLLAAVSHDLRTPLAVITGASTTLRDDPSLAPAVRDDLTATIVDEAERLERLVTNLLDMTRLDSGSVELKREWVPFDELVGVALDRLKGPLAKRPVSVSVPPDLPLVQVDALLMQQLLVNLLENAAKHTPEGSAIDLRTEVAENALVVEVGDRGPGIYEGDEERIFERFYRGPKARASGVGLGLPICRAIAQAHGGTIRARNRPDGGAVFQVSIPLVGTPPSMRAMAEEEEREG